jgi:hypothetical protein
MPDYTYKHDNGKLRFDLLDPTFEEGLVYTLTNGSIKYGDNSWKTIEPKRYIAALRRHLSGYLKAIFLNDKKLHFDNDTGLLHLDHLIACVMFLRYFILQDKSINKQYQENIENKTYIPKETK